MQVEGGLGSLGQLLEVAKHLLGGLGSEDLTQHFGKHCELVGIVG